MAQDITLMGASYQDVPAVTLPKTGGGSATFVDALSGFGPAETFTVNNVNFKVRKNPLGFALINATKSTGDATQAETYTGVLPSGYRPIEAIIGMAEVYSSNMPRSVVLSTNGNIVLRGAPTAGYGFSIAMMYACEIL